jgi:hypothetical protein
MKRSLGNAFGVNREAFFPVLIFQVLIFNILRILIREKTTKYNYFPQKNIYFPADISRLAFKQLFQADFLTHGKNERSPISSFKIYLKVNCRAFLILSNAPQC